MNPVRCGHVLLSHGQVAVLAQQEPAVRWPRALRNLAVRPGRDQPVVPLDDPLLRPGLLAFARPLLRVRVVLRQGRLTVLSEVAATAAAAGALSTLLLPARNASGRQPGGGPPTWLRPVGRVELIGAPAAGAAALCLRHVPGAREPAPGAAEPGSGPDSRPGSRPGLRPARSLVVRGWGPALVRPFVDVWAQDEHGWSRPRPVIGAGGRWEPVDGARFAAELRAALTCRSVGG